MPNGECGDLSFLTATVSPLLHVLVSRARGISVLRIDAEISAEISRRVSSALSFPQTSGLLSAGVCAEHSSALAKRGTAYLHNADNLLTFGALAGAKSRGALFLLAASMAILSGGSDLHIAATSRCPGRFPCKNWAGCFGTLGEHTLSSRSKRYALRTSVHDKFQ